MKVERRNRGPVSRPISRRSFLGRAVAGAATIALIRPRARGGSGYVSPNETLHVAGIGVGGMGRGNVQALSREKAVEIVALCDVDQRHAAGCFGEFPDVARHVDYRRMLETQKDIDAVMVATPDHMHAPISLTAMELGKHVYCEKPLTHTVREARQMAETARRKKLATQMGNRGQASEGTRLLCEWVWSGAIGPVREVHIWTDRPMRGVLGTYWPQGVDRPEDTPPVPSTLDWNLWLGVAPERPYHPAYLPFVWRGWWDFGTGALGDIGCHAFDATFRALKLGHPESVEASSSPVNLETYPLSSMVTYGFPERGEMPPVRLTWYDGGLRPSRPPALEDGKRLGSYTNGVLLIGDGGMIMTGGAGADPVLVPTSRMRDFRPPEKTLPRSPGHYREWVEACRGGKPAGSNFDHAGPLTEVVLLGNIALRRELRERLATGPLRWDGDSMQFTNAPEANRFVHHEYRNGWAV